MSVETFVYCAVRKRTGVQEEFIDYQTISELSQNSQQKADEVNKLIPKWAEDCPVVRIAKVKVTEITH